MNKNLVQYGKELNSHKICKVLCFRKMSGGNIMQAKKTYRKWLIILFLLSLSGIAILSYYYINISRIPDSVSVFQGKEEVISFLPKSWVLPVNGKIVEEQNFLDEENAKVTSPDENLEKNESTIESLSVSQYMGTQKLPADLLHINLSEEIAIEAEKTGSYQMEIRSFGMLLKKVQLHVLEDQKVVPCGNIVGIYGKTDGVLVLGTGEIIDINGKRQEPAYNIVRSGDYIIEADGIAVTQKEDLLELLKNSDGSNVRLKLRRNKKDIVVDIQPVQTKEEGYRFGIWVRNDTQGIGTLTFITEKEQFGALGHAITDIDTGTIIDLSDAGLYQAEAASIRKGEPGVPGEISGIIYLSKGNKIGAILQNTAQGVFGSLSMEFSKITEKKSIPIALKQEIVTGNAEIYCQIDGELKKYQIKIEKIDKNPDIMSKGMVIRIIDKELLKKTNGIIQGMSGSPIIQNGKFIGAVTHVFVNDSARGYGIFAENMLIHLQN